MGSSNLTLDGRDNPVQLINYGIQLIGVQDVIITNVRLRPMGSVAFRDYGITVEDGCQDIWIHHCDMQYGTHGCASVYRASAGIQNVLIEYNLMGLGLMLPDAVPPGQAATFFVTSDPGAQPLENLVFRRNLCALGYHRTFRVATGSDVDGHSAYILENVVYGVEQAQPELSGEWTARFENNYHKHPVGFGDETEDFWLWAADEVTRDASTVYTAGNKGEVSGSVRDGVIAPGDGPPKILYNSESERPASLSLYLNLLTAEAAYADVLANAGCTYRDELSTYLADQVTNGTGDLIGVPSDTGVNLGGSIPGLPDLA